MDFILGVFDYVSSLGSTIMVPIMFFLVALCFGQGFQKSFKIGLTIGIGFIGLNLVINLFWSHLTPIANALLEKFGLDMQYADAGWMVGSAIGFASPVGTFIIPFILVLNIILLATNLTKTLDVDIWNFWHFCFYGGVVYKLTNSVVWGYVTAAVIAAISLKIGDIGAKYIENEMGVPGISVPQCFAASTVPLGLALDKLYSVIPGLKDANVNPEKVAEKIGVFGEPATIGFILGVFLSVICGFTVQQVLSNGLGLAALLFLMPRMVKVLMEGLMPLSEAAKKFMSKHFKGKDFYIGLDSAITLANPTTIVASVILVPITLLVALLPFNKVLPGADLSAAAYYVCMFSIIHKGDLVKTLISGTVLLIIVYFFMTLFGPQINELAIAAGYVSDSSLMISTGVNPVAGPFLCLAKYLGALGPWLIVIVGVVVFALLHIYDKRKNG